MQALLEDMKRSKSNMTATPVIRLHRDKSVGLGGSNMRATRASNFSQTITGGLGGIATYQNSRRGLNNGIYQNLLATTIGFNANEI